VQGRSALLSRVTGVPSEADPATRIAFGSLIQLSLCLLKLSAQRGDIPLRDSTLSHRLPHVPHFLSVGFDLKRSAVDPGARPSTQRDPVTREAITARTPIRTRDQKTFRSWRFQKEIEKVFSRAL